MKWTVEHSGSVVTDAWQVIEAEPSESRCRKILCECGNPEDAWMIAGTLNSFSERRPIMLEMAKADDEHRRHEARWRHLVGYFTGSNDPIFADSYGRWSLHTWLRYAGEAMGFIEKEEPAPADDILTPCPDQVWSTGSYQGKRAVFVGGKLRREGGKTILSLAVPVLAVTDAPGEPDKLVQMVADTLNLAARGSIVPDGPIYWSAEELSRLRNAQDDGQVICDRIRDVADATVAILRERAPR